VIENCTRRRRVRCKEALFSLAESTRRRHQKARDLAGGIRLWQHVIDYLTWPMWKAFLTHTTLLPTRERRCICRFWWVETDLKPVAALVWMMLEKCFQWMLKKRTSALCSPDKTPKRRLDTIEQRVVWLSLLPPVLIASAKVGKSECLAWIAIRDRHLAYGHVQRSIIQNFRAKGGTAMAGLPVTRSRRMKPPLPWRVLILPVTIQLFKRRQNFRSCKRQLLSMPVSMIGRYFATY